MIADKVAAAVKKHSPQEIIKTLVTLQENCFYHMNQPEKCQNCPLGNTVNGCIILDLGTPDTWEIKPVKAWKALKEV